MNILLILCGLYNIVDGIWSLIHPRLGHWWLADIARIGRTIVGFIVLFIGINSVIL